MACRPSRRSCPLKTVALLKRAWIMEPTRTDSVGEARTRVDRPCGWPSRFFRWTCFITALALAIGSWAVVRYDDAILNALSPLSTWLHDWHETLQAGALIRAFGKGDVLALVALLVGLRGRVCLARQMLLALLITGLAVAAIKSEVHRHRPNRTAALGSFPSGDTASIVAVCVPVMAAAPKAIPALSALAVTVGCLRVLDVVHHPSDVLFGAALGILAGLLVLGPRMTARIPIGRWTCLVLAVLLIVERVTNFAIDRKGMLFCFTLITLGPACLVWWAGTSGASVHPSVADSSSADATFPWFGRRRVGTYGLVALLFVSYIVVAHLSSFWDRDEPRYAQATVEMLRSGNYLYPTFNGSLRPDKPVLIYWLMAIPVRLFGSHELAFRGIAIAATALAGVFTWLLGRRLFDSRTALLAACFLLASPLMAVSGTAATTDAVLLACIMGALLAFLALYTGSASPWPAPLLSLALGLALLVKGPVGLAIPLQTMLLAGVRQKRAGVPLHWGRSTAFAVAGSLIIFLAWALPANHATGGEFLQRGLGRHVLQRTVSPLESHGGNYVLFLFYYVPVILLAFMPWTLFLPAGVSLLRRGRIGQPGAAPFLMAWLVPCLVLMSLVATKLPHYVLPCWPGLALIAAAGVTARFADADERWMRCGRWLFGPVGLLLGGTLLIGAWFVPARNIQLPLMSAGLTLTVMTLLALRAHRRRDATATVRTLIAGMTLFLLTTGLLVMPRLEHLKLSKPLARAINQAVGPDVPVALCGYTEPSLIFYLQRPRIDTFAATADTAASWLNRPEPVVLITRRDLLPRLEEQAGPLPLVTIAEEKGYNYSNGKWADVVAVMRMSATSPGTP